MRLCYVLNQFPELSQTFVLRQVLDLLKQGHAVDVIAARPGNDAGHHQDLTQLTDRLGLDTCYTGMPSGLLRRALRGAAGALPALLRQPGAVATALDVSRFGWFAASGSLLTMGLPLLRQRRQYDALVAHFGPQGMIAQGLREMGILTGPLVTFFHAYDLTSAPRLAGRSMYRRLFERGELLLAISRRGAGQLRALGAPDTKIRVHHMGVDVSQFRAPSAARRHDPTEPLRVVSIGRLMEKKGFDRGLRAVAQARARGARLVYAIYGTGPDAAALEQAIGALGLRGCAQLCGPASQQQLAEVLRNSDLLLAPSVTSRNGDEEGIPMVLMEALASELPVLATHSGAVSELVAHEDCGLLVPEGDLSAMADALCELAASPALAARLGQAGRARVVTEFNEQTQGQRLAQMLLELSAARGTSAGRQRGAAAARGAA